MVLHIFRQFRVKNRIEARYLKKSNLRHTRGTTSKRETSGGVHIRDLALGQHMLRENVDAVASRWRHCVDLTGPGIELQTFRTDSNVFNN